MREDCVAGIGRSATALLLTLAIIGCATTPVPAADAKQAPAERVVAFQTKPEGPSATLVVTRDAGFVGSGCFYAVSIDGTLAARLDVEERATFFVVPGELVLRVGRDPLGKALCGLKRDDWTQRETTVRANETKYFRVSTDGNNKTDIQRSE